jgi:hypothetical protein
MLASELASITSVLSRLRNFGERRPRRGDHSGCHSALDKRRVHEPDVAVTIAVEHLADGEDGAAQVTQEQHTVTLIGTRDGGANQLIRCAEPTVLITAGRLDVHIWPCHLTGKKGQPRRQLWAV